MKHRERVSSTHNSKRMELWIISLYLITTIWLAYIGFYKTIYSLGIYTVFAIQGLGLLFFGILLILRRFKTPRNLGIAATLIIALQTICIIAFTIDNYKPTYAIQVPAGMEGCVYVFVTNQERGPVQIDEHGIGYMGSTGDAGWELRRGNEDISALFSMAQSNEILVHEEDGKVLTAYDVVCYHLHEVGTEPVFPLYRADIPCMDAVEFLEWVKLGVVDETRLRKTVWRGSGNGNDWVLDNERSRL